MTNFTPEQQRAIQSWTEQRDKLLREIGLYTTERNDKKKEADAEALRLSDLHVSIAEARGRISELTALEERHKVSVSIDVKELEARKSRLESECETKQAELKSSLAQHAIIVVANDSLKVAHETMKDQAQIVKSVVSDIIETSKGHLSDSKILMADVRTIATEVIEKGKENVKQTNIVLGELPRFIFEMQKPIPIRRAYATPKGTIVRPKEEEIH